MLIYLGLFHFGRQYFGFITQSTGILSKSYQRTKGRKRTLQEVMSKFRSEDKQDLADMLCIFQLPIVHSSLLCVLKGLLLWMNYQG